MPHRLLLIIAFMVSSIYSNGNPIDSLRNRLDKVPVSERFNLWLQIGLHYREAGVFDSAKLAFVKAHEYIQNEHDQGIYYHNSGGLNWRTGDYTSAASYYDSAIATRLKARDSTEAYKSMYYLSLVYRDQSAYNQAIVLAEELIQPYLHSGDSVALADIYNHLGSIYLRLNQYDSADVWYKRAVEIRFAMKDSIKMADSYSNMGKIARERGLFSDAVANYKQSLTIYASLKDRTKEAYTRLLLGGAYWEAKSYQEALQEYLRSLRLYEYLGNKQQVASVQKNIGLIYRDIGNIDKAVEYHTRSLEVYRSIGNKPLIGVAVSILAGDYWSAGNYHQALKTYEKALVIRKELGNKTHIAGSYNNLALAYKSLERNDSALVNYRRALLLYMQLQDQRNEAAVLNNIGSLYQKSGNLDSADIYIGNALKLRENIEHVQGIGYSSLNLGQVFIDQNKITGGIQLLLKAREVALSLNEEYLLKESCVMLSETYQKLGQYKKALEYHQEFHAAEKRLQVDESIRRVADMQIRFEAEKRMRIVEKKDAELKQQALRIYYLLGGMVLMLVLIIVVAIALIQKRRSNKLLAMRNDEIQEQKAEIEAQRDLAEQQRDMISEQNDKIRDSILYASRIQNALLPPENLMSGLLKQHFILFKPRDVVSGDFYYFQTYKQYTVIAAADCTGHGVPGAFMSMLGISVLNEIMASQQIANAGDILEILRSKVKNNLHQTSVKDGNSDGMDIALVMLDREKNYLYFAGANNPLIVIRNKELIVYEGDRMPIGVHIQDEILFKNNEVQLEKGDKLYLYSDGYVDQFGGSKGRKLMSKNFKNLLLETSVFDMRIQKEKMDSFFETWKRDYKQIDDVVVIGLEI